MKPMKKLTILAAVASIAILAGTARAELCPKCKGLAYTADIGKCKVCGGDTSSGAFQLCKACSAKLQQCEHCRAALGAAPTVRVSTSQPAGGSPAASSPATSQPASKPALAFKKEEVITEESEGKTIAVPVGQKIVIRIPSAGPGPKPPPKWTTRLDGNTLTQVGVVALQPRTTAGPGGSTAVQQGGPMVAEAIFVASGAGKTTVTLEARPQNQPDAAPTKTFKVTVESSPIAIPTAPPAK
jgi:hypothetical protein